MSPSTEEPGGSAEDIPRPKPSRGALRLLSIAELLAQSVGSDLVEGLIPHESICCLCGPPGAAKTFVAISIAMAISSGRPWLGRAVGTGSVVYVTAEGKPGFPNRVRAALIGCGLDPATSPQPEFFTLADSIALLDRDAVEEFTRVLDACQIRPAFIVFDTLARCLAGADENDAGTMGCALEHLEHLRVRYGCCILVLHHVTKDGKDARGSSALRGGVDALFIVRATAKRPWITFDKVRDGATPDDIDFLLREVDVGTGTDGAALTSCEVRFPNGEKEASHSQPTLTESARVILTFLASQDENAWSSASDVIETTKLPRPTAYRHLKELLRMRFVRSKPSGNSLLWQIERDRCRGGFS